MITPSVKIANRDANNGRNCDKNYYGLIVKFMGAHEQNYWWCCHLDKVPVNTEIFHLWPWMEINCVTSD